MKTIEEEKLNHISNLLEKELKKDLIEQRMDSFDCGVEFAQRWIPIKEEFPEIKEKPYQVIIKDKSGVYNTVYVFGDQEYLKESIFRFLNVTHWRSIEYK